MKRRILIGGILLFQALAMMTQTLSEKKFQLPDYPVEKGVSAPFAGFVGDWLVVGGGCNFPDIPAAEGGKKVYYNQCYALNIKSPSSGWIPITQLPLPVAYGCSVETPQGLVCIGGNNADSCLTHAYRIQKESVSSDFVIQLLPSLPEAVDNASATILGDFIYLTGGNQQYRKNSLYRLNLEKEGGWERLASFPGAARVQPILVSDNKYLYLIGGFQAPFGDEESVLSHDMLRYDPKTDEWVPAGFIPQEATGEKRCMVGGSGVGYADNLILTGGVNYSLFKKAIEGKAGSDYLKHEPSWYLFNDDILCYDVKRRTWKTLPDVPGMARAGGILLCRQSCLYMICGEIKPGIRTSKITVYPFKKEK